MKVSAFKPVLTVMSVMCIGALSFTAKAQTVLDVLAEKGSNVTALGTIAGLRAFEIIPPQKPPYWLFLTPTNDAVMGLPYDRNGNAIRLSLSKKAQESINHTGGETESVAPESAKTVSQNKSPAPIEPRLPVVSERTTPQRGDVIQKARDHVEGLPNTDFLKLTNNIPSFTVGSEGPLITVFMDPRCPYCESYYKTLRPLADRNQVQFRVVPVDVFPNLAETSYRVVAADEENRQQIWEQNLLGSGHPEPLAGFDPDIGQDMVIIDAVFRRWHPARSVPYTIYQNRQGEFRQIEGIPSSAQLTALLQEAR